MGASHLEHATLSPPSLARTLFVNSVWIDSQLTYRTSLTDRSQAFESSGQFSSPKQTPMETWDLVFRFHCCSGCPSRYRHLEILIRLLIGPIFRDVILDLENNRTHCSRNNGLLISYCPYERPILLILTSKILR